MVMEDLEDVILDARETGSDIFIRLDEELGFIIHIHGQGNTLIDLLVDVLNAITRERIALQNLEDNAETVLWFIPQE